MENKANLAALKEKQDRVAFLETVIGHFLQKVTAYICRIVLVSLVIFGVSHILVSAKIGGELK